MVKLSAKALDSTFSALADPTRRGMVQELMSGERSITELAQPYQMSLPAISKHVRILENAGLVEREKKGRVHFLRLRQEPIVAAESWFEEYRKVWESRFDRLESYLDALQNPKNKN